MRRTKCRGANRTEKAFVLPKLRYGGSAWPPYAERTLRTTELTRSEIHAAHDMICCDKARFDS
jgi:hypothetical protein